MSHIFLLTAVNAKKQQVCSCAFILAHMNQLALSYTLRKKWPSPICLEHCFPNGISLLVNKHCLKIEILTLYKHFSIWTDLLCYSFGYHLLFNPLWYPRPDQRRRGLEEKWRQVFGRLLIPLLWGRAARWIYSSKTLL